jgi:adenine-specific DNA-methyltransferase
MNQQPGKMNGKSLDISSENRARLKQLFPTVFTETKNDKGDLVDSIDFEKLKAELGTFSYLFESRRERYGMDWPGKKEALRLIQTPSRATLKPCREESVNFDTTGNLYIEGDNLEVLKLLQKSYYGKVKMIDIDPPYNTGKEFIYPDNFSESLETYLEYAGLIDGDGKKFSTNTANEGRFHTKWLNMMYPRLYLARNLLRDDGVIFVSIDDNEASNIKTMMDDIFGPENYLVTHYVQVRYGSKTLAEKNDYQKLIEQVLVYQKSSHRPIKRTEDYSLDKFCWKIIEKKAGTKTEIGGKSVEIFPEGHYEITKAEPSIKALKETWATGSVLIANASGKYFGTYLAPRKDIDGLNVLYKVDGIGEDGLGYRYFTGPKKESATKGKFFSGVPLVRVEELNEGESLKTQPIPNFYDFAAYFGNCRHEGDTDFRSGKKPIAFISEWINQSVSGDESAIILDFFAGSASTAHAVLDLNKQDKGNRKFILVQLPEPCAEDSEALKAGCKTIADIGKERIRRVIKKFNEEEEGKLDLNEADKQDRGFRVFKLDKSNFKQWQQLAPSTPPYEIVEQLELHIDHISHKATPEDLLYEILLKAGFTPSERIETKIIADKNVFSVADGGLLLCLEDTVTKELIDAVAEAEPMQFICLDSAFHGNDQLKANAVQTFAARNMQKEKHTHIIFKTV